MTVEDLVDEEPIKELGVKIDNDNLKIVFLKQKDIEKLRFDGSKSLLEKAILSVFTSLKAYKRYPCDVFVDTLGIGFQYPFIKTLFGCKIYSYVHNTLIERQTLVNKPYKKSS